MALNDIILSIKSPLEHQMLLAEKAKKRRLFLNYSRKTMASKAGVNVHSLRRFEESGEISLTSFIHLLFALGDQDSLLEILKPFEIRSLDELRKEASQKKTRKRGHL
jgi:transcriptional regulator with XRE-family HTH domain